MAELPSNNVSQLLYYTLLPKCPQETIPIGKLIEYTKYSPNDPSTYGTSDCTDTGLFRQAMMSQYYNYMSGNNQLKKP